MFEIIIKKGTNSFIHASYAGMYRDQVKLDVFTEQPYVDNSFLRRIGAKNVSFVNGRSRIKCQIDKAILKGLEVFTLQPFLLKDHLKGIIST